MFKLNVNERKSLSFHIELSGIDHSQLEGSLKFIVDNIEYGFPVKIEQGSISVDIPALINILPRDIKEGEKLQAKLEVHGNGYFMNPWNGEFDVELPVKMEAVIVEESKEPEKPIIKVVTPKVIPEEDTKYSIRSKSEKLVQKKLKLMDSLVDSRIKTMRKTTVMKKKPVNGSPGPSPEKTIKEKIPENVTEKDIFKMMESAGIKRESTQISLLERAKSMSGDLNSTYETVSNMLGITHMNEIDKIRRIIDRNKK